MTRVVSYVHPNRTFRQTTGVGKHIVNMIFGLRDRAQFSMGLMATRQQLVDGRFPAESWFHDWPVTGIPGPRSIMEWSWTILHRPWADRWSGPCDWIYCPAETFVPTQRAKLAVTIHDVSLLETDLPWSQSQWARRARRVWRRRLRPIHLFADLILTVSEFSAQRIRALLGEPRGQIVVVGNGVEDVFFAPNVAIPDTALFDGRPYVLMVGGLDQRKGADIIFEVARHLRERQSELIIAIAGFMSDDLRQTVEATSNMRVLGYVDTTDLPGRLRGAVALLFPSRYEGFGIPALEAMAAGTPAVVSRITALPEIVGEAGLYVDIDQPRQIAEQLIELSRDSTQRQQFITLGRRRAEQFRWSNCVDRLAAALQQ